MSATDILKKYKQKIASKLKSETDDIQIQQWIPLENGLEHEGEWFEVPTFISQIATKDNFLGMYRIAQGDWVISEFKLLQMPNCCAFLIATKCWVHPKFQNKGIGTILNLLRQDIARELGYTALICTDIESNIPQRKILEKNGWKDIYKTKNQRTGNNVFISLVEL